jgi:hypothetical protein
MLDIGLLTRKRRKARSFQGGDVRRDRVSGQWALSFEQHYFNIARQYQLTGKKNSVTWRDCIYFAVTPFIIER